MLGVLRFVFSLMVIVAHLGDGVPFVSHLGVFAVFGFYLVSGYLMTLVLNGPYRGRSLAFWKNRILRIYPAYYLVAVATLVFILVFPEAQAFHGAWLPKSRAQDWLGNLAIVPFEFGDKAFRLVPPSWSLAVELIAYFLIWLALARHRMIAYTVFAISVYWHLTAMLNGVPWYGRYMPFYAALLPFSLGASLYYLRDWFQVLTKPAVARRGAWLFALLALSNAVLCGHRGGLGAAEIDVYFYANLALLFPLLACCVNTRIDSFARVFDKRLGDLAYPMFLVHWLVGGGISQVFYAGTVTRGWSILIMSLPLIVLTSLMINRVLDGVIEPMRSAIRSRGSVIQMSQGANKRTLDVKPES